MVEKSLWEQQETSRHFCNSERIECQQFAASEALRSDFLAQQSGLVSRELLRRSERKWIDLVVWDSKESAERAALHAATSQTCAMYFHLLAGSDHADPGAGVLHLEGVKTYS